MAAIVEIGDPFHTANALLILLDVYKKIRSSYREEETLRTIASLPDATKGFIFPGNLALVYQKLGLLDQAKEAYINLAALGGSDDPGIQANFTELLLLRGELREAAPFIAKLVNRPEPKNVVIGRLMSAICLVLEGKKSAAEEEIRWLAQFLLSMPGLPRDFAWDFRDSQRLLDRMTWPEAQLVLQALTKEKGFDEFREEWSRMHPAVPPSKTLA